MLTHERYRIILEVLNQRDSATVTELAAAVHTSESTIRRDLIVLDREGHLKKVFGGAVSVREISGTREEDLKGRERLMAGEKRRIACLAASLIDDDDFVFLDAGTTTSCMTEFLTESNAFFVTGSLIIARRLSEGNRRVFLLGGRIKASNVCVVGADAEKQLQRFHFTKSFLGTNGIDIEAGFSTTDPDEAIIKQTVMEQSLSSYVLADHSKFRKIFSVSFAAISRGCILTDQLPGGVLSDKTEIREATS